MHASDPGQIAIGRDGEPQPARGDGAPRPSRRQGVTVATVAGVVGLGAVYGGIRLLADAEALGVEQAWLERSPFSDYRIPGLVLLVVIGGGMLLTAVAALRRSRTTGRAAVVMGVVLLAWGVVETLAIGYRGSAQLVLLVAFVVVPATVLLASGRRVVAASSSPGPTP